MTPTQSPHASPSKAAPRVRQGGAGVLQSAAVSRPHPSAAKPDDRGAAAVSLADAAPRPLLTGSRPAGSVADYDRLCEALDAYEAAPVGMRGYEVRDLRDAAGRCGWVGGPEQPLAAWAKARVETYRKNMAGAVSEIVAAVVVSQSLERAIGLDLTERKSA